METNSTQKYLILEYGKLRLKKLDPSYKGEGEKREGEIRKILGKDHASIMKLFKKLLIDEVK